MINMVDLFKLFLVLLVLKSTGLLIVGWWFVTSPAWLYVLWHVLPILKPLFKLCVDEIGIYVFKKVG